MKPADGFITCKSSNRFGSSSEVSPALPVAFPPGLFRLATSPSFTGSVTVVNTIGISFVRSCAPVLLRGRPRHTVRRELEALHMLRLLQCEETDEYDTKGKGKVVRTIYEYSLDDKFDRATLLAMTKPPNPP